MAARRKCIVLRFSRLRLALRDSALASHPQKQSSGSAQIHPCPRACRPSCPYDDAIPTPKERDVFVIFGATGHVGRVSATALRRAGRKVRAVVRHEKQGEPLAAIGCEVAVADLNDAASVARAIDGAHAVQMLCPVPPAHADSTAAMRRMIEVGVAALRAAARTRAFRLWRGTSERHGHHDAFQRVRNATANSRLAADVSARRRTHA